MFWCWSTEVESIWHEVLSINTETDFTIEDGKRKIKVDKQAQRQSRAGAADSA